MEETSSILKRFKETHPALVKLKPKIEVWELLNDSGLPSGEIKILVKRPFIFDARLIPSKFENVSVQDITVGRIPAEFPDSNASLPWFEIFSCENYSNFVSKHQDEIRKKLLAPSLSKHEMLDALTGDFNNYKTKCENAKQTMLDAHSNHIAFFKELLEETGTEFNKSEMKQVYGKDNQWYYSVLATSIFPGKPMVVGFNWGAAKNETYKPQKDYPLRMFESNFNELGSLKRTIRYFYDYYPDALTGMQSNFCFYRSYEQSQVSQQDLKSGARLFFKLLEYSKPSSLVIFSSILRDYLIDQNLMTVIDKTSVEYNRKNYSAIKGVSRFNIKDQVPIYCIPHPMTKIGTNERNKLWEFCFKNQPNNFTL